MTTYQIPVLLRYQRRGASLTIGWITMADLRNTDWNGAPVQRTEEGGYISTWTLILLTLAMVLILASSLFVGVTVWEAAHSLAWGWIAAAAWMIGCFRLYRAVTRRVLWG